MHMAEQEIYNSKNHKEAKTTAAPFPTRITRYQCSKPIIHFNFSYCSKKNYANKTTALNCM